jgi:hypothetical protein
MIKAKPRPKNTPKREPKPTVSEALNALRESIPEFDPNDYAQKPLLELNVKVQAFDCIAGTSPNSYEAVSIQTEGRVLALIRHTFGDGLWRCENRVYNTKEAATEHEMGRLLAKAFDDHCIV